MKRNTLNDITLMQFIFIIHGAQVGTGVFSLPMELASKAGTDGWMTLIIGWCCNIISSILIVLTLKKYPNDTLVDLLPRLFGKFIGKVLIIPFIFYFAFFIWTILSVAVLYIKHWFLPMTPDYIIVALLLAAGFTIARNGVRVLGRFNELVFYMMLWMPFVLLIPLKDSHWIHLLPLFKEGWKPIFYGLETTILSFLGFEIVFFIYPFLQRKQLAIRGIVIANTLTLFTYLGVTLICFAYFSPDEITNYNQPLLNLLKVIDFSFLERFDMIFLVFYLFIIATAWLPNSLATIESTKKLLGKENHSLYTIVFFLLIIVLVFALHPSWNQTQLWQQLVSKTGIGLAYVFPLFLFVYVHLFNRYRKSES